MRRRAGAYLQRFRALAEREGEDVGEETGFEAIVFELQRLRFGRGEGRDGTELVFRQARDFLRRKR